MSAALEMQLAQHLLRADRQEDLTFALWTPADGTNRRTALLHTVLLPERGDRAVHGNVSYNAIYLERACRTAMREGTGIALLHSHPGGRGWQLLSADDVIAEQRAARAAVSLTDLPLVGLTIAGDESWSGRMWDPDSEGAFRETWCHQVRVVGKQLCVSYNHGLLPAPALREQLRRTVSVWGPEKQAYLTRLRIGIVGLGSVGSMVAETLARSGFTRFVLIDFDRVEDVNLDRLVIADSQDVGRLKVDVASKRIRRVATAADVTVERSPYSIVEEQGYRAALDCDVLFSCVDRPRPRQILNHLAYNHLIPVIDGGIQVRFRRSLFAGVDWQLQTVGPERVCLECLGAFDPGDAATEAAGLLDDPSYIAGLPAEHHVRRNENVFAFAANLASLEVLQLVALATRAGGVNDFGIQRYRYNPGIIDVDAGRECQDGCERHALIGQGDRYFHLYGHDLGAERARVSRSEDQASKQISS